MEGKGEKDWGEGEERKGGERGEWGREGKSGNLGDSALVVGWIDAPANRHHLSCDYCLEDKRKDYQNSCVLYCVPQS